MKLTSLVLPFTVASLLVAPTLAQEVDPQTSAPVPSGEAAPQASIYSPAPEHDFGEILQGEKRQHTFQVGNRGEEDVIIRSVNPTCGCTVAEVKTPAGEVIDPKKHPPNTDMLTLKPGETCEVSVEFNSRGQPTHQLEKHIMVISSDNREPALRLTMKMNITSGIQLEPNPLQFGEVVRGENKTERVYAKLQTLKDLEITGFEDKPDYFDVKWEKAKAPDGADAIAIDVTLLGNAPIGYVAPALVAKTNDERLKQIQIQLYAHVKSEVVFDTGNKINKERMDFEVIPFGESRTRTLEIRNGNPSIEYKVEDVVIESMHKDLLKLELETIEEGKYYKVNLTTDPALDARFFRGKLIVKSNYPEMPEKEIHFHGWIKKS